MTNSAPQASNFVGRQQEMAVLTAAMEEAISGVGQMVMLAGEPGIGKTRLAQELAVQAESSGAQVLWGWCYEHAGAPPYWPYVQPIRSYVEATETQLLSSHMGAGGAEIAEIVPGLREKLPELGEPMAAGSEQARFRLFDSVATFMKNASQDCPLVFVVDDLHWADESSLLMLEFVAREIAASPILILGTYRDAEVSGRHPLSQTLGNLVRERHYRRVQLGGLTTREVGEFVSSSAGIELTDSALETIHDRTDGNPLFVNEVVELIDPSEVSVDRAWADRIPEGVRDAIGTRLGRLSETCNQTLRTASVIGREFDFSLLRRLDSDIGLDEVLLALEEALDSKVVEALPGDSDRYQFRHALIQQSLYEEMSPTRRARAHAKIGETLEEMHQAELEDHAAELAHHFSESEGLIGTEKSVHYSLMAGEQALATYSYGEALLHFESALDLKDQGQMDGEIADLLFGLGRAQVATRDRYQFQEALANVRRAFDYYAESGDVERAVACAEFPVGAPIGMNVGVAELTADALRLVPAESLAAGRLLATHGLALYEETGDYQGAQVVFQRALAIAKKEQDEALELRTLANSVDSSFYNFQFEEAMSNGLRAIELSQRINDPRSTVVACTYTASAMFFTGNLPGASEASATGLPVAERFRDQAILGRAFWISGKVAKLRGDSGEARQLLSRGLAFTPRDPRLRCSAAINEYESGDFEEGAVQLEQLVAVARSSPLGTAFA